MRKPKTQNEIIAVAVVACVTGLHLAMRISNGWNWSFLTSIIGVLFLALFLSDRKEYGILLMIWALIQMVVVTFPTSLGEFDLSQIITLKFGLTFNSDNGATTVGINPLGILYFVIAIRVRLEMIHGKQFELRALKSGTSLDAFLPSQITVIKRLKVGEESSWYLVKIGETEKYGLIRGKDEMFLKSGKKMIVKYLFVEDSGEAMKLEQLAAEKYTSGAWAVIP